MEKLAPQPPFKYPPLKNPRQIRLIQVHPTEDFDEPIDISFVNTDLDRHDFYQTLSYTWGETFHDKSHLSEGVFCDGKLLPITSNLNSFLKHFRQEAILGDSSSRMPIWIDAISINQDDNFEREQQVAMMAQIYKCSFQLTIWLGNTELLDCTGWPFAQSWDAFIRDEIARPNSRERSVIEKMVQHQWFRRRWIIQEVSHTRKRTIWIGSKKIPWNNFCAVVERLEIVKATSPLHIDHAASFLRGANPKYSLLQNLFVWSHAECGDPRDRIYALLSISDDKASFDVDYSIDTETLYYRIAKQIAQTGPPGSFEALLINAILHPQCDNSDLPTWVPDWRNPAQISTQKDYAYVMRYLEKTYENVILRTNQSVVFHRYLKLTACLIPHDDRYLKDCEMGQRGAMNCSIPRNTRMYVSLLNPVAAHKLGKDFGVHQWCFSPNSNIIFGLSRAANVSTEKKNPFYQLVTFLLLEDHWSWTYRRQRAQVTVVCIA